MQLYILCNVIPVHRSILKRNIKSNNKDTLLMLHKIFRDQERTLFNRNVTSDDVHESSQST